MTVIIGYTNGKNVWMIGDEAAAGDCMNEFVKHQKVFKSTVYLGPKNTSKEDILIGYAGSFRMGQLLQYKFKPSRPVKYTDIYEYLCTKFVDEIKDLFEKNNYSRLVDNEAIGGSFLVGAKGRLFTIQNDFSVLEYKERFTSIGGGYQFATASMETFEQLKKMKYIKLQEDDYIELALKTSIKSSCKFYAFGKFHEDSDITVFKV